MPRATETATFGGGCFWCTEAVMLGVRGVERVVSGYAGGPEIDPTYEQVCSGRTGHAEVVQVTFDPAVVSYRDLLGIFFATHDPTTPDRQGADVGPQYRSIVLTHSDEQRDEARRAIADLEREGVWDAPIVTRVEPLDRFWPAESYHQRYFERNPGQPYCRVVIEPKVAKLRRSYAHLLR